jgi:hypothetical protein
MFLLFQDSAVIMARTAEAPVGSACRTSVSAAMATFRIMSCALSFQVGGFFHRMRVVLSLGNLVLALFHHVEN